MMSRALTVLLLLTGSAFAQLDSTNVQRIDMTSAPRTNFAPRSTTPDLSYSDNALVSVSELGIPARARKEFDKGTEALRRQDFKQARHHFGKAIDIYPAFAGAYNNLGVVFARLGEADCERESLQSALQVNDHFELAYVNWARMDIAGSNFADAESALKKASNLDASDPVALILLAYSELALGDLKDTIATSEKAHALAKPHAFVHRIAARAYEKQNQFDRAIAELRVSLDEEPTGSRADTARQELQIIQAMQR